MARKITDSTPRRDGFRMPAEFEPQERIFMIWPQRPDNWRMNAVPAQKAYTDVAKAISKFTPVTMFVSCEQFANAREQLPAEVQVLEMSTDDAWCRDVGPIFLVNDEGERRACDWKFNAWGGEYDGLYSSWEKDDAVAVKICEFVNADRYRLNNVVLEGGSIHVDGEGTVLTTEMCLLSKGRNDWLNKEQIESTLMENLNATKVLWLKDGIDPDETDGHIDDVACFVRPGEVACIYTEDVNDPFYEVAQENYKALCEMTDAKGRALKVYKVCTPSKPVLMQGAETIVHVDGSIARKNGDLCIASYLNFLITNDGVIVPQYDDANDELAIKQLEAIFPDKTVVGVHTKEIVYGGGNIHCITQQLPLING